MDNCLKNAIKQKENIKWLDTAHPAYVKSLDVWGHFLFICSSFCFLFCFKRSAHLLRLFRRMSFGLQNFSWLSFSIGLIRLKMNFHRWVNFSCNLLPLSASVTLSLSQIHSKNLQVCWKSDHRSGPRWTHFKWRYSAANSVIPDVNKINSMSLSWVSPSEVELIQWRYCRG